MGAVKYCIRKEGFQICNGDCYWCDRFKEEVMMTVEAYNDIPEQKYWIFTFGLGKDVYGDRAGKAVRILADSYGDARRKMCERYGNKWAFQYSAEEWERFESDPERFWYLEEVVEEFR